MRIADIITVLALVAFFYVLWLWAEDEGHPATKCAEIKNNNAAAVCRALEGK
jgi:multidrug resistance efflux pump